MATSTRRKIARSAVRRVKRAKKTHGMRSRKQAHNVRTGKYSTSNTMKTGGGFFDLKWNLSLTINGQRKTIEKALDIKLSKNFFGKPTKYELKIEIDIDKYRYKMLPLVNTIFKRLFNDDTLIVYDDKIFYNNGDFGNIATYDRTKKYNPNNTTYTRINNYICDDNGEEEGYEDPLMNDDGKPKKNCIIEIEIEPEQPNNSTKITLKKYTGIREKGIYCKPPKDYHKDVYILGKIVQTEPTDVITTVQKTIPDFDIFKKPGTIDLSYIS